jgi:hypothetical protein
VNDVATLVFGVTPVGIAQKTRTTPFGDVHDVEIEEIGRRTNHRERPHGERDLSDVFLFAKEFAAQRINDADESSREATT